MEDFIERVGQSYLERKAFAVPQQLENFAKKQLTGGSEDGEKAKKSVGKKGIEKEKEEEEQGNGNTEKKSKKEKKKSTEKTASRASSSSSEKDKEIARLKKLLAQSKLESPKASSGKSAYGLKTSSISRAANGQKSLTKKAAKGKKEMKESATPEAREAVGGRHAERKSKNREKEPSDNGLATEANIVEVSPTERRTSTSQHKERDAGVRSQHGGGSTSGHSAHAKSVVSHATAVSEGQRRSSTAPPSVYGSTGQSAGQAPMHEPLPIYAERFGEERAMVELPRSMRFDEQERDVYAVEVEQEDIGGVVEVEDSKGRMFYRVDSNNGVVASWT